jgi:UDP-3-O-[3-hydroxymyristoyl] glucosamine N-acyltransferase
VIGSNAMLAGQAGVAGHVKIGDGAVIGGKTGVSKDVAPGSFLFGFVGQPYKKYVARQHSINRIPKLKEQIAGLEKRLAELEESVKSRSRQDI